MKSNSSALLAVPAAVIAVVCGVLLAVFAPRLDGGARVAVVVAGIVVSLAALAVAGYLLGRSTARGGAS